MKRLFIYLFLFTFYLILGCESKTKVDNINQTPIIDNVKKIKKYEPIFLGFSPKMTKDEFQKQCVVERNNKTVSVKNNLYVFPILIDNLDLNFNLIKGKNYIKLYSKVSYSHDSKNSEKNLIKAKSQTKILFDKLISIFSEKYNSIDFNSLFPNQREVIQNDFGDYLENFKYSEHIYFLDSDLKSPFKGFQNSKIFSDSIKTIVVTSNTEYDKCKARDTFDRLYVEGKEKSFIEDYPGDSDVDIINVGLTSSERWNMSDKEFHKRFNELMDKTKSKHRIIWKTDSHYLTIEFKIYYCHNEKFEELINQIKEQILLKNNEENIIKKLELEEKQRNINNLKAL